jgi:hypothetical protein
MYENKAKEPHFEQCLRKPFDELVVYNKRDFALYCLPDTNATEAK